VDGIILTRSSTHEKMQVVEMFSAPRVEASFGAQIDIERVVSALGCVALGIVEKRGGAIRVFSEPRDTRIQVPLPMIAAKESSP
jgi:hypothetical protein